MSESLLPVEPIVLNPDFATTRMVIPTQKDCDRDNGAKLSIGKNDSSRTAGGLRTHGYSKQSYGLNKSGSEFCPLVTVVTVVYNNDRYLEATIKSIINQSYSNIEYIIVDGGSTDLTLEIIQQYEQRLDYWISESDSGLYDAMNKGIALATGEIIGILNSDDLYFPQTIEQIVAKYQQQQQPCVIYGSMYKFAESAETASLHRGDLSDLAFQTASISINHPTCFVHHSLYRDFGGFKPEFEVGADRELMMRFHNRGALFVNLEQAIARFRLGGTTSNQSLSSIIHRDIIQEYRLLAAYSIAKTRIAQVLCKKTSSSLRKWLFYKILGEKLTNQIIMSYISRKFSQSAEK